MTRPDDLAHHVLLTAGIRNRLPLPLLELSNAQDQEGASVQELQQSMIQPINASSKHAQRHATAGGADTGSGCSGTVGIAMGGSASMDFSPKWRRNSWVVA